jgi:hypothetical protein
MARKSSTARFIDKIEETKEALQKSAYYTKNKNENLMNSSVDITSIE